MTDHEMVEKLINWARIARNKDKTNLANGLWCAADCLQVAPPTLYIDLALRTMSELKQTPEVVEITDRVKIKIEERRRWEANQSESADQGQELF